MKPLEYEGNTQYMRYEYHRVREGPNCFVTYYKHSSRLIYDPKDAWRVGVKDDMTFLNNKVAIPALKIVENRGTGEGSFIEKTGGAYSGVLNHSKLRELSYDTHRLGTNVMTDSNIGVFMVGVVAVLAMMVFRCMRGRVCRSVKEITDGNDMDDAELDESDGDDF